MAALNLKMETQATRPHRAQAKPELALVEVISVRKVNVQKP